MGRLRTLLSLTAVAVAAVGSWFLCGYLESTQRLIVGPTLFVLSAFGLGCALALLRLRTDDGAFLTLFVACFLLAALALIGYVAFSVHIRNFAVVPVGSGWTILHQAHFGYPAVLGLPVLYTAAIRWMGSLLEHEFVLIEATAAE